jgi:hypothetical protein
MERAGLTDSVEVIQRRAADVCWGQPVSLLLVDGLHDYFSVAQDFYRFERWVVSGGLVAFHDYAPYFPGVRAFVNELLGSGYYRKLHCVGTMIVLQKAGDAPPREGAAEACNAAVEVGFGAAGFSLDEESTAGIRKHSTM